jgi:hypothetical protein
MNYCNRGLNILSFGVICSVKISIYKILEINIEKHDLLELDMRFNCLKRGIFCTFAAL